MVSSSTPLFTILVVMMLGLPFDLRLLAPVLVVTIGVASCAAGELKISWAGLVLTALSSFTRGLRSTLQQNLLNPARTQAFNRNITPMDPVELLLWMSIPSVVVLLVWSALTEGWAPWQRFTQPGWSYVLSSVSITCVNACILNVANLFVIKDLGAVACQLAGQLKSILIMLAAVAVFSEPISIMQIFGFVLVFVGVFWYNRKEAEIKGGNAGAKAHKPRHSKRASFCKNEPADEDDRSSLPDILRKLHLIPDKDGETIPLLNDSVKKIAEP
jgi:drug/metabolite transporter (DMT)-like permease